MMRRIRLDEASMENILESLLKRSPNQYDSYQDTVNEILNEVKEKGDEALFHYTKKFDKAEITLDNIRVTEAEIQEEYAKVETTLVEVMKKS